MKDVMIHHGDALVSEEEHKAWIASLEVPEGFADMPVIDEVPDADFLEELEQLDFFEQLEEKEEKKDG